MEHLRINGITAKCYFVDEEGNVFSTCSGELKKLKQWLTHDGYYRVMLGGEFGCKMYRVNRIVAETFIPNPNNYPIVLHKNDIRHDNRVDNLEWGTNSKNQKQRFEHSVGTKARKVAMLDPKTKEVLRVFESPVYAFRELGIQAQNIAKVCRGERRVAGGYAWKYVDCPSVETIREE